MPGNLGETIPTITVGICTRNRPDDIIECVRTVLANPDPDFEVLVFDQSDDAATSGVLREFEGDPRLRHHPSPLRGKTRALNELLRLARAEIVALTDDDCRVPSAFVASVRQFFQAHPGVALAFGTVTAPPELLERGLVATFEGEERMFDGAFASPFTPWGIGANMAFRVKPIIDVGAFDPNLGPGAYLPIGGDEMDLTMRVIGAGFTVAHTRSFVLEHLGVREWPHARAQFAGYSSGAGVAYMKNIRLRTPGVTKLFGAWLVQQGAAVVVSAVSGRRPSGLGMMLSTLRGSLKGLSLPLDHERRWFKAPGAGS